MVVFRLKKVSESTRKVQNVRQLITQIRQKVFQKGAFPAVIIYLERMVTIMKRFYTAESVTEGHPDKLALRPDRRQHSGRVSERGRKFQSGLRGAGDQKEHHCGRRDHQPI